MVEIYFIQLFINDLENENNYFCSFPVHYCVLLTPLALSLEIQAEVVKIMIWKKIPTFLFVCLYGWMMRNSDRNYYIWSPDVHAKCMYHFWKNSSKFTRNKAMS